MSESPAAGRKPWLAVVLSLCAAGLGHLYAGQVVKGLVLFLLSLLLPAFAVLVARQPASTAVLVELFLSVGLALGLYLYAVIDAYRVARGEREQYRLRDYNNGLVYALFILVGVLYPVGLACYIRAHVFEAFYIPSEDMAPTIVDGDHVLADKSAYLGSIPQRGDVIIFRVPQQPSLTWIKRVIGLPGDTVEIKEDQVFVNGKQLEHDRVPARSLFRLGSHLDGDVFTESASGRRYLVMIGKGGRPSTPKVTVPEGTCFVLGDHRNRSRDSREFGFISLADVLGRVQYIYYPAATWDRFGALRE
jgi:signal peptidase I